MTARAELGTRCCITMATSGWLQMKKGLRFQGLWPEGGTDPAFVRSPEAMGMLGAEEGGKEGLGPSS